MIRLTTVALTALLFGFPALAWAQLPGEPKAPPAYDPTGDAKYVFERGSPDDRVRQAQRVLGDRGYYTGPLDGLLTPATRRAIWSFQKASGLRFSGRLESETMAALGFPSPSPSVTNFAPRAEPDASALPTFGVIVPRSPSAPDSQAP